MREKEKIIYEKGSGNVFADLGFSDADELITRAKIAYYVFKILEDRELKQVGIAEILDIKQPEVSHLMNGHYSRFTADKLLSFLAKLNRKVTIQISPHKEGEPYSEVCYAG